MSRSVLPTKESIDHSQSFSGLAACWSIGLLGAEGHDYLKEFAIFYSICTDLLPGLGCLVGECTGWFVSLFCV